MLGWEFPPHISGGLGTACQGIANGLLDEGVALTLVLPTVPAGGLGGIDFVRSGDVAPLSEEEIKRKLDFYGGFEELIEVDSCINPYFSEDEYQFQKSRVLQLSDAQRHFEYEHGTALVAGAYGDTLLDEVSRFARAGTRLGLRGGFDIVYAHDWMTMLAGLEASHQSGAPLVLHVHSTEYDRNSIDPNPKIVAIERYAMQRAAKVVTVSNRSRDILVNNYGVDAQKVEVVYNALTQRGQPQKIESGFREKLVLFMGRITEQKGPEYFIRAAKKVLQRDSNLRFVMAGCGDQLPRMVELVAAERMERHFHFSGFLRGDEVEQMFNLCDLFVMPSVSEPFGIAPLEAMGFGLPAIVSKQSGVAEVLAHALKVDFWDIDAMAMAIEAALEDDELGRKSAQEVAQLSWSLPAQRLRAIFVELMR